MPTPHNNANKEDISKIVLMSGDPLRAKYIAEKYLTDVKMVNDVRGMYAYTGYYKNKRITVMGHGMGMPSIGIYTYELFKYYDVDVIIRMGSCGSHLAKYKVGDIVLANEVNTLSNISEEIFNRDIKKLPAFKEINDIIIKTSKEKDIKIEQAPVTTVDVFDVYFKNIRDDNSIQIAEMEAFALYSMAFLNNKKCACLLTVVDSTCENEEISSEDREKKLDEMIVLGLESTLKL